MSHVSPNAARADRGSITIKRRRPVQRSAALIICIVLVAVLACAVWLGLRALTVKNELDSSRQLVAEMQAGADIETSLSQLGAHASAATGATQDPLWNVAEKLPFIGENLGATRLAAESIDLLANRLAVPLVALGSESDDGGVLARALPILAAAKDPVGELGEEISLIRTSTALVPAVRAGIEQVHEVTTIVASALDLAPYLLGTDTPKSYLLAFQNNAETLPLGGSAASQTLISANGGDLTIVKQASSASYENGTAVDVTVDQSALDLYSTYLIDHANTSMSRPDFPTAAQILRAFWQRDVDPGVVDGVISVDPIALGRILLATGPVQVGDVVLTHENAVSILLSDAYQWWNPYDGPEAAEASDAFFATVAQTVFDRIASGDFNLKDMAWAIQESVDQGDIMVWSDDPVMARWIQGHRVSGVLPADNVNSTTVGIFYRDTSASKIDYYMKSAIDLSAACVSGNATFTATAALHLDITQDAADALPSYVQSFHWGSAMFRTEIFVYGPPGTAFVSASVAEGSDARPMRTDIDDLGRPVASFETFIRPGGTAEVTAVFSGAGQFGPLELRSTPMVHPTAVAIGDGCAG